MFQSTHPRGVRLAPRGSARRTRASFNPRTRVGCDALDLGRVEFKALVSIHAPAWGATVFAGGCCHGAAFQSTHPRGVRPHLLSVDTVKPFGVSIHAPAWGATKAGQVAIRDFDSFNPRTRVGCDTPSTMMSPCSGRFQSTHPRGVRRARHFHFGPGGLVSIHAPAWGATRWAVRRTGWNTRFQSTHPRGVRLAEFKSFCATCMAFQSTHPRGVRQGNERAAKARALLFQSTHPRGVRHAQAHAQPCAGQSFNPRTRVGCDRRPTASRASSTVSIHAPAWGATDSAGAGGHGPQGFNPRTRVGCD